MKTIIADSGIYPEKQHTTSDMHIIKGLMSCGHVPVLVFIEDRVIRYTFDEDIIIEDLNDMLTNKNVTVLLSDVWVADQIWTMNLHKAKNVI